MEVVIQWLDEVDDLVSGFALWVGTWPRMLLLCGSVIYFTALAYLQLT